MEIKRTVYNRRLLDPWTYIVTCGGNVAHFDASEKAKVGEWIISVWESQEDGFFNTYSPAYVYFKYDYEEKLKVHAEIERQNREKLEAWKRGVRK